MSSPFVFVRLSCCQRRSWHVWYSESLSGFIAFGLYENSDSNWVFFSSGNLSEVFLIGCSACWVRAIRFTLLCIAIWSILGTGGLWVCGRTARTFSLTASFTSDVSIQTPNFRMGSLRGCFGVRVCFLAGSGSPSCPLLS